MNFSQIFSFEFGVLFRRKSKFQKNFQNFLIHISYVPLNQCFTVKFGYMGGIPRQGGVTLGKGGKESSGGRFKYLF